MENPMVEISAMQLVGDYHANIMGAIEILQDEEYLYTITQYCSGGDLFSRVSQKGMNERVAQVWFRQILAALFHLQRKGVCHCDLSLENILLDGDTDQIKLIDWGTSLRVPHVDPNNLGGSVDVSEGTIRRLIKATAQQQLSTKLIYMAPEVVSRQKDFDGYAVDLWAAGIILFILLVGLAPFQWAHESDARFAEISSGKLRQMLVGLDIHIGPEASHLLQGMLWRDPAKRLTLAQVMQHPWVLGKKFKTGSRKQLVIRQPPASQCNRYREVTNI